MLHSYVYAALRDTCIYVCVSQPCSVFWWIVHVLFIIISNMFMYKVTFTVKHNCIMNVSFLCNTTLISSAAILICMFIKLHRAHHNWYCSWIARGNAHSRIRPSVVVTRYMYFVYNMYMLKIYLCILEKKQHVYVLVIFFPASCNWSIPSPDGIPLWSYQPFFFLLFLFCRRKWHSRRASLNEENLALAWYFMKTFL